MRPSKQLEEELAHKFSTSDKTSKVNIPNIWLNKKGCPKGSVPIRRTSRKQLKKSKFASRKLQPQRHEKWNHGVEFAGIYIEPPGLRLYGAGATISIYNPKVRPHESSSAVVAIQAGHGDTSTEEIIVGWTVDPDLNGDDRTRLFTSWRADNHTSPGCYNMVYPGFVLVNSEIPIDYAFLNISVVEKEIYDVPVMLSKDLTTGHWWVSIYTDHRIGYWPHSLFSRLTDAGEKILWGGAVFTPPSEKVSPPMGNGELKNGIYDWTCYMRQLRAEGEKTDEKIQVFSVASRCYREADHSYKRDPHWGYSFLFGGSGGTDHGTCEYPFEARDNEADPVSKLILKKEKPSSHVEEVYLS